MRLQRVELNTEESGSGGHALCVLSMRLECPVGRGRSKGPSHESWVSSLTSLGKGDGQRVATEEVSSALLRKCPVYWHSSVLEPPLKLELHLQIFTQWALLSYCSIPVKKYRDQGNF